MDSQAGRQGHAMQREAARRRDARPSRSEPARPARSRLAPVLVLDPDPDVRGSTALLVSSLGYRAVEVGQPEEALEAVLEHRPGLILIETQFPGLNLAGFVAALRSHPRLAGLPVVFYSAGKDLPAQALRHQVWATLPKPFEPRQLALLLERALGPSPESEAVDRARAADRQVRDAFRELRNLVTALDNYVAVLDRARELSPDSHAAVRALSEVALKLEARADRLRSFVLSLLATAPYDEAPGLPALPPRQPR